MLHRLNPQSGQRPTAALRTLCTVNYDSFVSIALGVSGLEHRVFWLASQCVMSFLSRANDTQQAHLQHSAPQTDSTGRGCFWPIK